MTIKEICRNKNNLELLAEKKRYYTKLIISLNAGDFDDLYNRMELQTWINRVSERLGIINMYLDDAVQV